MLTGCLELELIVATWHYHARLHGPGYTCGEPCNVPEIACMGRGDHKADLYCVIQEPRSITNQSVNTCDNSTLVLNNNIHRGKPTQADGHDSIETTYPHFLQIKRHNGGPPPPRPSPRITTSQNPNSLISNLTNFPPKDPLKIAHTFISRHFPPQTRRPRPRIPHNRHLHLPHHPSPLHALVSRAPPLRPIRQSPPPPSHSLGAPHERKTYFPLSIVKRLASCDSKEYQKGGIK